MTMLHVALEKCEKILMVYPSVYKPSSPEVNRNGQIIYIYTGSVGSVNGKSISILSTPVLINFCSHVYCRLVIY